MGAAKSRDGGAQPKGMHNQNPCLTKSGGYPARPKHRSATPWASAVDGDKITRSRENAARAKTNK